MKLKIGDAAVALILLAAALAFAAAPGGPRANLRAQISVNGAVVYEVPLWGLSEKQTYVVRENGYTNVVAAENGAVWVESADCPDRVCVNTGRLVRAGQSAVCMKTRLVVRVLGEREGVDAVSG